VAGVAAHLVLDLSRITRQSKMLGIAAMAAVAAAPLLVWRDHAVLFAFGSIALFTIAILLTRVITIAEAHSLLRGRTNRL
jgi:hypothetical protein